MRFENLALDHLVDARHLHPKNHLHGCILINNLHPDYHLPDDHHLRDDCMKYMMAITCITTMATIKN